MLKLRTQFTALWIALVVLLAFPVVSQSQTFRGGISGTVTDQSGAVVPGAQVTALDPATNVTLKAVTSSAGEFSFADLPLGSYTLTVNAGGFKVIKIDKVPVTAGSTYALPVKLSVASAGETIEVTAASLAIDTVTDTQETTLPEVAVQNIPNSGRDFTQMLAQTTGFAGFSTGGGAGNASVNGSRSNDVNWQIEGTDNNDLWWNIPAVNQGGVSALAGVILPIDSIENFSFVTSGTTELGRNSGGTANLTIKAGTNTLHGSGYYYNHNEMFQKINPFTDAKTKTRDIHYGYSVGGPIWRDKTFFFLGGEYENFLIGAETAAFEPSAAYQAVSYSVLDYYGVPHNQVAQNLLNGAGGSPGLWPASALTGPYSNSQNYTASGNLTGHSYNGIIHLDENLTEKDHLSATWFVGQGTQTAPTSSALTYYFENAPIHVQNYSLVYNRILTPSISNQLSAGVSYFNQAFSDENTNFNLTELGLNTGVTSPTLAGSPHLIIGPSTGGTGLTASGAGFDPLGVTAPSGRNDITGHLDELLAWTKGAHQMKFGGEFRQAQVDDFYQTGQRGTIYFDNSQGPWSGATTTACALQATQNLGSPVPAGLNANLNSLYLADFLAGCYDPTYTEITQGDPKRQVFVNTFSLYGQDALQVSKRLSLNFGIRYDYEGPVHSALPNLSIFDPSSPTGLAVAGQGVANIYPKFWGGVAPRAGFSYQVDDRGRTVLRGGYGIYYDSIYMKSILQNNGIQNISVFGPGQNPAGDEQVFQAAGLSNQYIQSGVDIFPSSTSAPTSGIKVSTFDPHFRPDYSQSFDLNIQQSFSSNIIWQFGYVGNKVTHLMGVFDINAPEAGTSTFANPDATRPYYSQFPQFSVIDSERSNLGSNYNSFQTTLRLQNWHNLTSSIGYTLSHALDYETGLLPYLPQNPNDERDEHGNSDFDIRHTLTGYIDYVLPTFRGPKALTRGWEFNSGFTFHGGVPFTVLSATNPSNNSEGADRAFQLASPYAGISHTLVPPGGGSNGYVQWFNPASFTDNGPSTNTPQGYVCADTITPNVCDPGQSYYYSGMHRGQYNNPGYAATDLSVIKNTNITERIKAQFRVDIFNIFNHTNMAPVGYPGAPDNGGTIGETIGPYLGNPGIGPGEPANAVFALKIIF
jgi:hypothetical protein